MMRMFVRQKDLLRLQRPKSTSKSKWRYGESNPRPLLTQDSAVCVLKKRYTTKPYPHDKERFIINNIQFYFEDFLTLFDSASVELSPPLLFSTLEIR